MSLFSRRIPPQNNRYSEIVISPISLFAGRQRPAGKKVVPIITTTAWCTFDGAIMFRWIILRSFVRHFDQTVSVYQTHGNTCTDWSRWNTNAARLETSVKDTETLNHGFWSVAQVCLFPTMILSAISNSWSFPRLYFLGKIWKRGRLKRIIDSYSGSLVASLLCLTRP